MDRLNLLPFHFREFSDGKVLLSNMVNQYSWLDSRQQLEQLIEAPDSLPHSLIAKLQHGLILAPEKDLIPTVQLTTSGFCKTVATDLASPRLIMIVPTLRCDHSCSYCQVSRVNADKEGFDLSVDDIPNIIETIVSLESAPFKIEFQGGEALIRFDFIQQFYSEFAKKVGSDNFSIVIATSLSLLDDAIIEYVKGKNITFSTSVDAGEWAHNHHRRIVGQKSYQYVSEGIKQLHDKIGPESVATVSTITREGLSSDGELIEFHLEHNLTDMFVRPVSDYGFALGRAEETVSVKDFVAFVRQLITEIVEINLKGQRLTEQFFMVHYRRFINAQGSTYVDLMAPAGYLKNTLLFDFNGNVFGSDEARMLHRKFGGNDFVLGNIRDERKNFNTSLSESLLNQTFLFDQPGCNTCVYQGSCGADPVYHVQSFGEPIGDKALSRFCQLHMAMFDLVAEMSLNPEFNAVFRSWLDV